VCQFLKANDEVMAVDLLENVGACPTLGIETVHLGKAAIQALQRCWTGGACRAAVILRGSTECEYPSGGHGLPCPGRIIMVGKAGMELRHVDFYKKGLRPTVNAAGRAAMMIGTNGAGLSASSVRWMRIATFKPYCG
jgi:hypothetical protein